MTARSGITHSYKETKTVDITNLESPGRAMSNGKIVISVTDKGESTIECTFGGHQCGMVTDKSSLYQLRDALTDLLD
ncbi:hypothetical protein Pori4_00027 [Pseudomonas phage vB_PpuM-Pori-4]